MEPADNNTDRETVQRYDHVPIEFGQRIAAARKARSMSEADMAHHLNLTSSVLSQIEAGQWEQLGPLVYIRGYVRACARELSISDSDTDDWFRARETEPAADQRASILAPARRSRMHHPNRVLGYVAATALLAIPASWLVMRAFDPDLRNGNTAQTDAEPVATEARLASITVLPARQQSTQSTTQLAPVASEPAAPASVLSLLFEEQAWLEVRTADGERLSYGLVAGGTHKELPLDRGLVVRLGNVDAVAATLNGESFDLDQFATDDLAEFSLDPQ